MVLDLAIPEKEPIEVHIYKLATGVHVGRGIPPRKVLGLKAQALTKSDVKTLQFMGVERKIVIKS